MNLPLKSLVGIRRSARCQVKSPGDPGFIFIFIFCSLFARQSVPWESECELCTARTPRNVWRRRRRDRDWGTRIRIRTTLGNFGGTRNALLMLCGGSETLAKRVKYSVTTLSLFTLRGEQDRVLSHLYRVQNTIRLCFPSLST